MSNLYFCGDTHHSLDIDKLKPENFQVQESMTKDDVLVVLGDWGGIWYGDKRDKKILDWWESRPWTTFVLAGNHDNYAEIEKLPLVEKFGAPARKVSSSVFVAETGNIYNILGYKCLCVNGADSIDRIWRTEGIDWWSQEAITQDDVNKALISLAKVNDRVDLVLSHTGGTEVVKTLGFEIMPSDEWLDVIMSAIHSDCEYLHLCAHYHKDKVVNDNTKILYDDILMLEEK